MTDECPSHDIEYYDINGHYFNTKGVLLYIIAVQVNICE